MKNGDKFTLISHGINWNWYLTCRVVWPHGRMKVEILKHWRVHQGDEGHPDTIGSFELLENTSRTVCAVQAFYNDAATPQGVYAVENPKYVFDY